MANPWRSERLIYCAIEDEHIPFLTALSQDPEAVMNANPRLPVPQGSDKGKGFHEWIQKCLIGVIICLPASTAGLETGGTTTNNTSVANKPIPIGQITMSKLEPDMVHHRHSSIGIMLTAPYRGQGYGSEAIKWALDFGFRRANLHRIEIGCFGFNEGAARLYKRLGFVVEAVKREIFWHDGRYHDCIDMAMLKREWELLVSKEAE